MNRKVWGFALAGLLAIPGSAAFAADETGRTHELFLRDAFTDSVLAGYRWESGVSLAGMVSSSRSELPTGTVKEHNIMLVLGQRIGVDEAEDWRSFWDLELGLGRNTVEVGGNSTKLRNVLVGSYIGAEVELGSNFRLAARLGVEYASEEVNASRTDSDLTVGVANVDLNWSW